MMTTTRTTIKRSQAGDIYVGRPNRRVPAGLEQRTEFGNPFPIGVETPERRREVIEAYRRHLLGSPEMLNKLPELRGKRLVCWCPVSKPWKPCHVDVLIELLDSYTDRDLRALAWALLAQRSRAGDQIQAGEVRR